MPPGWVDTVAQQKEKKRKERDGDERDVDERDGDERGGSYGLSLGERPERRDCRSRPSSL